MHGERLINVICMMLLRRVIYIHKVDNPCSISFFIRTIIFEWYVVWCGSKNIYQKVMC
jgi:hypothetical protein